MTTFFQLSDTHLLPNADLLYGTVDPTAQLSTTLHHIRSSRIRPAALIFSGDLADGGQPEAYGRFTSLVSPISQELGAPIIAINGNHDDRVAFASALFGSSNHSPEKPLDYVVEVEGVRIICLDSTVPGHDHGELSEDQLTWLREQLTVPAPAATLLVLHHPPIHSPIGGIESIMLRHPQRLAEVVRGSTLDMILAGHTHYVAAGFCGGVPVWVCGATAYRSDTAPPGGRPRCAEGGSFTRVDLIHGEVTTTALPVLPARSVLEFPDARPNHDQFDGVGTLS